LATANPAPSTQCLRRRALPPLMHQPHIPPPAAPAPSPQGWAQRRGPYAAERPGEGLRLGEAVLCSGDAAARLAASLCAAGAKHTSWYPETQAIAADGVSGRERRTQTGFCAKIMQDAATQQKPSNTGTGTPLTSESSALS